MHPTIVEQIAYERGKNQCIMDDQDEAKISLRDDLIKSFDHFNDQLEELIFLVGDRPEPATEDEILNYIIGMQESVNIKKAKLLLT